MKRFAAAAILSASPALADYSDHDGVRIFSERPCTEVIAELDRSFDDLNDGTRDGLARLAPAMAKTGMTFGFLLGFDTAEGGLQGAEETTLRRLRLACARSPQTPALDLLRDFTD